MVDFTLHSVTYVIIMMMSGAKCLLPLISCLSIYQCKEDNTMQHKFSTLKAGSGAFAFLFCFSLLLGCTSQIKTVQAASDADAPTHIVGIDPGHQGPNVDMSDLEPLGPGSTEMKAKASTGTQGAFTGLPEYQLNLDISLKLKDILEDRGYEVILTRTDNDTAISNKERAEHVADQGAEVYVRIHANGAESSSASGALTISPSSSNPYIPQLYEESSQLSQCILDSYCQATGFANLGVSYYDNMTGINWSSVPVTIVEMGFMTNEQDDQQMSDPDFQDTMAQGIADGIDSYFNN